MPATIIDRDRTFVAASAAADGDKRWLSAQDLARATGWELKPQGFCLDERCVPIPPSRRSEFVRPDGLINLTAFAELLGRPLVADDPHQIWMLGEAAEAMTARYRSVEAPDFTLPDLDGKLHSLSDYRGKKILLISWASW